MSTAITASTDLNLAFFLLLLPLTHLVLPECPEPVRPLSTMTRPGWKSVAPSPGTVAWNRRRVALLMGKLAQRGWLGTASETLGTNKRVPGSELYSILEPPNRLTDGPVQRGE